MEIDKDHALGILLIASIVCGSVAMYALYNIDQIEDRCDAKWQEEMVRLNCIDVNGDFRELEPYVEWSDEVSEVVCGEAWQIGNEVVYK